jgi:hypothetical protein
MIKLIFIKTKKKSKDFNNKIMINFQNKVKKLFSNNI